MKQKELKNKVNVFYPQIFFAGGFSKFYEEGRREKVIEPVWKLKWVNMGNEFQ